MKVRYDSTQKIMGIGLVPWSRLGPYLWFSNYKIASLYEWDVDIKDAPEVIALNTADRTVELPYLNTPSMLANPTFQKLLIDNFKDTAVLAYKSVEVPEIIKENGMRFLTNDTELAHSLENKAYFRRHFSSLGINFPKYRIYDNHPLVASDNVLNDFLAGDTEVVVQDAQLGGGKGTFMVSDMPTLQYCFESLIKLKSTGTLVVSKKINSAHERSVQCVATRYGVFVGPLQKQIIAHPLLANLNVPNGDKFCGIELNSNDAYSDSYPEIKKTAEKIGEELITLGYKGIFGLDCLVDESGDVYILEINPRITGATPLLTMLYRKDEDIPFYLLHILELTGADYEIEDASIPKIQPIGSLLMAHALNNETKKVTGSVKSGLYDTQLNYRKAAIHFDETDDKQILLQQYIPPSFKLKPGGRTSCIFTNYPVLSDDDSLSENTISLISTVQLMTKFQEND
ncbi:MAG: ATP-grasp domain-containing protein [Candidatus Saccharimonadales bacterium]